MPSPRRLRLLCIVAVAVLFTLLFTSRLRQASDTDANSIQGLYHKTRTAIDRARADGQAALQRSKNGAAKGHLTLDKDADGDIDQDDEVFAQEMSDRLRAAEQKAKDLANSKSPNKPDAPRHIVGVGSSAGGQTAKKKTTKPALAEAEADEKSMVATSEDKEAKAELDTILRKSPSKWPIMALIACCCEGPPQPVLTHMFPQLSSFRNHTVRTPSEPRAYCWKSTAYSQPRTSSNWTSTPSAHKSSRCWVT